MRLVAVIPGKLCSQDSVHSVTRNPQHKPNEGDQVVLVGKSGDSGDTESTEIFMESPRPEG